MPQIIRSALGGSQADHLRIPFVDRFSASFVARECEEVVRLFIQKIVCFVQEDQMVCLNLKVEITAIMDVRSVVMQQWSEPVPVTLEQIGIRDDDCDLLV